jgi:hypothetical protein
MFVKAEPRPEAPSLVDRDQLLRDMGWTLDDLEVALAHGFPRSCGRTGSIRHVIDPIGFFRTVNETLPVWRRVEVTAWHDRIKRLAR